MDSEHASLLDVAVFIESIAHGNKDEKNSHNNGRDSSNNAIDKKLNCATFFDDVGI